MPIVHLKNSAGVITEYTVTPPQTLTGIPAGSYTFTEGLTSQSVTVTAAGGGTPTPTPPTLGALTLSPNTATVGTAYTGTVSGKTANSTLALSGAGAAGLSVSGTTVSGTPTTSGPVNIVETLAGATGSPRTSSGVLTVAVSGGATPSSYTTWTGPGWFDFSDTSTITLDSGAISSVTNKRGNGANLTASRIGDWTSQPSVKNGLAVARLARGVGSATLIPRLTATTATSPISQLFQGEDMPYTVILVWAPTDTNTGYPWAASGSPTGAAGEAAVTSGLVRRTTNSDVRKRDLNAQIPGGHPANVWRISAVRHTGTEVTAWENSTTPLIANVAQNEVAMPNTAIFRLGVALNTGSDTFQTVQCSADYGELILEGARTNAEVQAAIAELAPKWGITLT